MRPINDAMTEFNSTPKRGYFQEHEADVSLLFGVMDDTILPRNINLDTCIEMTIRQRFEPHEINTKKKRICLRYFKEFDPTVLSTFIKRSLPAVMLIGYLIYFGFAIYLNVESLTFLYILTPLLMYACINNLTRGLLKKKILWTHKKTSTCLRPSKRASLWIRRVLTVAAVIATITFLVIDIWNSWTKWTPVGGLAVFILLSTICSKHPRKIVWTTVIWGLVLQFGFGLVILRWKPGFEACQWAGQQVTVFLGFTDKGSEFVFGEKYIDHPVVFKILPVVVFFSSMISVLYYLGLMQIVIKSIAMCLECVLGTTPIESFATAAHIFIGQVESSITLRPFWGKLTESEIHAIMTGGYATVAGTVIAAYVEFGVPAEHVISASFMSAPAALAIAKISLPETEISNIRTQQEIQYPSGQESNLIEALSLGAIAAIKLVAYVVVNLIAFVAVLNFLDTALSYFGARINCTGLTFQMLCSYIFMPVAVVIGVPWNETNIVGALIGKKIVINEFLAYADLGKIIKSGAISDRGAVLTTYMLCGFGSIAALGINLGSLSSAAPDRRSDFARLSLRSMINGNIACFMTACIAGLLYQEAKVTISEFNTTFAPDVNTTLTHGVNTTIF